MEKGINFEEIFLSFMGDGKKLQWELDNYINLVDYCEMTNRKAFHFFNILFSLIPEHRKEAIFGDVTSESILDLLKKERPDIHEIIMRHPRGVQWVRDQVENFKKRLFYRKV